jgi:glycosyltransferase involved in cell wall biosynthesis
MKICIIYNFAQHYRTSIFQLIDLEYDCDFFFGDSYLNIKKMDYSLLKGKVTEGPTKHIGAWSYRPGIQKLLWRDYDAYILLGESRSLSTWLFCIRARLFHPRRKVYFWSHGWYGKESRAERIIKKLLFKLPNGGSFLYGNYSRELMIKEGFNPEKLYVIHNSLAYDEQVAIRKQLTASPVYKEHFGNENPNLMFIGRLTHIKKLDQVLRAMAQLKDRGQNYNMTFIGGGETQKELQKLSSELGLEKNVWFYGPCYDEKKLSELIYNADLCVSPGNVGLTAMHAMVFGTPVLTHNDFPHQMPEFEAIHEGETGAFFKIDDVASLAEGVAKWFAEKGDKREDVRKACMKEIDENWTPQFQIEVLKKHLR